MSEDGRTKTLYRIKGISGEFNASATIRVAAGSLQMTLDNKDNKAIRKWVDDHVENFKWSENYPAQINGALKKLARGDRRGKRNKLERNIIAERLAAAIQLLKRLDPSSKHKVVEAEITQSEKALDSLADRAPGSLEAFVSRYGDGEAAAAAIAKVGAYTPFTFPEAGTADHEEMLWVVRLAGDDKNLEKLKKQALATKTSAIEGILPLFAKVDHAKAALHAVRKMVRGEDPDAKPQADEE